MEIEEQAEDKAPTGGEPALAAWKLPPIVAAIAVSIVGGFYLGGPGLGMAVGALAAASIIVMAVRHPPLYPIVPPPAQDFRRHILIILSRPLEDSRAIESVADAARGAESDRLEPEVLLVAPCRNRFLDRWTSDSSPGLHRAQRTLVLSAASLAKAEIEATARVGDEDLVQTVEDELRHFPATEVIRVSGSRELDAPGNIAAKDLKSRLRASFRHLSVSPEAKSTSAELDYGVITTRPKAFRPSR
jgi:hypothetical protein